jgi:hypothetical protein
MSNRAPLIVLILGIFVFAPAVFADTANLSVTSPTTVSQESTFTVDVNISAVTDLYDYQLDLAFNPTVLMATGITEGSFLPTGGPTIFIPGTIDNVGGSIAFNADTLQGPIPGVTSSAGGTLIEFDFTALAPGTSALTVQNESLQDSTQPFGDTIPDSTTAGSVTVSGGVPIPEPGSLILLASAFASFVLFAVFKKH